MRVDVLPRHIDAALEHWRRVKGPTIFDNPIALALAECVGEEKTGKFACATKTHAHLIRGVFELPEAAKQFMAAYWRCSRALPVSFYLHGV